MANRTLRRPRSAANGTADNTANTDGREQGSVTDNDSESAITDTNTDNVGGDTDSESNEIHGSVGVVEIDPAEFDAELADTGTASGDGDDSGTRKRRRRSDAGTSRTIGGRGRKSKASPPSVDAVVLLHTMASVMLKTPELMLEKDEAQKLCDGLFELQKHFDIPVPSEKTIAIGAMVAVAGQVYGTRIMAINMRKKMEREARKAKVVDMAGNPVVQTGAGMG